MSQEPPYGEPSPDPHNPQNQPTYPTYSGTPPPYGTQPYGTTPYGTNPYGQRPKNNTTRNVLIIVGVVVLLMCGGAAAGLVAIVGSAKDTITRQLNSDYRGSDSAPLTVAEGDAFSIRGMDYGKGWSLGQARDYATINKLRVTNNRDDETSERLNITFKFLDGSEIVALVYCRSNIQVGFGESLVLTCNSSSDLPSNYDKIKVSDSSLFE